uniref:Reticulon domain-containing protein n=1 Tax=Ascaris lumbricoides TaxID=6252 RepID=A0A0M3HHB5_ASCLU
ILGIFSIPKFYEVYQEPIDHNITIAKEHINNVTNTMNEKLPFLKKMTGTHEKTN